MSTHTEIFEHTDGDEDRIRVVHIEEGLSLLDRRLLIDTREVDGGWVQVVLGRDDALRLVKAITDALEPGLTVEQLDAMGEWGKVVDAKGDVWIRSRCNSWYPQLSQKTNRVFTSKGLNRHFGPITAVQA